MNDDRLITKLEEAAHEVDDNRLWLLKPFLHVKRGIVKAIDAASRITDVFAKRKNYAALIKAADDRALSGSRAAARGVTIAQETFSGTIASLFRKLEHFPIKRNNRSL